MRLEFNRGRPLFLDLKYNVQDLKGTILVALHYVYTDLGIEKSRMCIRNPDVPTRKF